MFSKKEICGDEHLSLKKRIFYLWFNFLNNIFSNSSKLKCENCDASFSVKGTLKRHIASVHERKKPYECENCDAHFAEKGYLKRHIWGDFLGIHLPNHVKF